MGLRIMIDLPDLAYYLSSNHIAVVRCHDRISIVREPGDLDDDTLRASVNAPLHATVQRFRQEPAGPDLTLLTWSCMVCGVERFDAQISVAQRTLTRHGGSLTFNLRYCNDRPECIAQAHEPGPWPRKKES